MLRWNRTLRHTERRFVIDIDLGDVVASFNLRVKCCGPRVRLVVRVGAPHPTTPDDRIFNPAPFDRHDRKAGVAVDLRADMQVPLSVQYTDEVGNPVGTPPGATVTYTVDDPNIINLTDNGDGTATAAATGTLGTANVHVTASFNGTTVTGDLQIVVVEGLAERITVIVGEATEVTPDTTP